MRQPLPEKQITQTEAEQAARFLGLSEDVDSLELAAVKEAYRKRLLSTHPDTRRHITQGDVSVVIARAKRARQTLEIWIALRPKADCSLCRGSGHVPAGPFKTKPCPKCG